MKILLTPQARTLWHDRTITPVNQSYDAGAVASHTLTVRWTYTVPASTKTFVQAALIDILNRSAVAGTGISQARINATTAPLAALAIARAAVAHAVAENTNHSNVGSDILLLASDILEATTEQTVATTQVNYFITAKLAEFAA